MLQATTSNTPKNGEQYWYIDQSVPASPFLSCALSQTATNVFQLFTHGKPGLLLIDGQWKNEEEVVEWFNARKYLSDKTHLNIYGCHFAQGEKGRAALAYLEIALGISVAASDDLTGIDGDWDLEVGNFKNGVTIQEYSHNLQQGTLPIENGMAATTCGSFTEANQFNSDPNGYVFGIFDIREPSCAGTPGANAPNAPSNWAGASGSNAYHDSRWTNTNLGEVFGVDLEYDQASSPDIFLSSCGLSSWHNSDQYPMTGGTGGEVFRIDGTTGDITVLATLPSTVYTSATGRDKFTGLGNLSYNANQQKVYVTNLDNGYIHVVDATTTNVIDQTYDPTPSIPEASFEAYEYTRRTRLVYGIEYNKCDNRLYFARPNTLTTVDIFSVGLNADGTIDASTPTLETTVTVETNVVISDIEFSDDCTQMLTSERQLVVATQSQVFLLQTAPHFSDVKRHDLSGGTWSLASTSYSIGNCTICTPTDKNAGGGVSFGYGNYGACGTDNACADAMVATSDALVYSDNTNIYGLQISDIAGTSSGLTNSYFVDLDGNTGSGENADKSTNYDVDVFGVNDCSVASCSLNMSQTSTCSESGGVYTQTYDLTLNWIDPPATGDLTITLTGDGTLNTSTVSAATLAGGNTTTLAGAFTVPADGNGTTTITATFDDDSACTSTFTLNAPVPCPADVNPCASTAGCIGGKVFEDFNCNGADDADAGIQGVQIEVYDCNNNLVGTGYSDSDGDWQVCSLTDGDTYRIEVVEPANLSPSHVGTDNGSSVQFVQPGSCTDFALLNPLTACFNPTAQKLITTCFTVGDPLTGGINATDPTIINSNFAGATDGDAKATSATAQQTGSVWGLAYTSQTDVLYMAAILKRHSGLGPDGLGAIYSASPYSSPPSLFYDLSAHVSVGTIPDNSSRGLGSSLNDVSHDVDAFSKVGKVGIGDIDITPDGSTLYVVNLFDKLVYAIDINNPSAVPLALPALPDPGCTNGEARPWGLKYHNGALYASLTCTAENGGTRDDLEANVYKYNGTSWSASILQIPLNYTRGCADWAGSNSAIWCNWNPWVDDWADFGGEYSQPSPILSDIEFDDEGNMILGFIDRTGHQLGHWNYSTDVNDTGTYRTNQGGDILKAHNNSGTYVLESNGTVGGQTASGSNSNGNPWNGTGGPNSTQGPGGGEFFWADYITVAGTAPAGSNEEGQHSELASGGLAISAADNIVLAGSMDPNGWDQGGVIWLDNTNGSRAYSLTLYGGDNNDNLFGKATGIGDVEAIISCAPLPLEIGNYVWCDTNGNGIQDACESGISDILVQLYDITGTLVGQDTTVNGQYYFNQNNVDIMGITVDGSGIASPTTAWSGMSYSTQYFIVFGAGGQFATNEFTIGGEMYGITAMANAGSNDNIDSDVDGSSLTTGSLGARPDGLPFIDMTTSATGCGDHKYDLGVTCTAPTYSLGNQVFTDTDNSGDLNGGETGIDGVALQLLNSDGSVYDSDPNTAGDQALTVTTANGGYYRFDDLPTGDYIVEVLASNFTASMALENLASSTGTNQEADPDTDGDLNDNGLDVLVGGAVRSAVVTLATPEPTSEIEPGTYSAGSTTGTAAADLFSNLTVDFGFLPCEVSASVIAGDQSICVGEDPAAFTVTTAATGDATLTYQWQSSIIDCTTGFTDIGTAGTSAVYDPPAIAVTTYYRVVVTNTSGTIVCANTSNCLTITVTPLPTPADAPFAICSSETSTDLTANDNTVLDGDLGTVSWYDGDPASGGTLIAAPITANLNDINDLFARVTTTTGSCIADIDVTVTITTPPSDITFTQSVATCSGTTDQNDGSITLATATAGTHYGVSNIGAAAYDGPTTVATATAIAGTPVIQANVPNTGGDYIVRVFNTNDDCYVDETVTVAEVNCSCISPTASVIPVFGSCTVVNQNNDGYILLTAYSNASHYDISLGTSYTGAGFASATAMGLAPFNVQSNVANAGETYTLRLFNENDACFTDMTIVVPTNNCPADPLGYIYCEETGEIITGGTITVSGPGTYIILHDGSTGAYQFLTDGVEGVYTMTYTPPAGYVLSTNRSAATGTGTGGSLDPTGEADPYNVGSGSTDGMILDDFSVGANPFYLTFELASGDPIVRTNNIPLEGCPLIDWGDLPDLSAATATGDYQTSAANSGPSHVIVDGFHLGSSVDHESNGQQSTAADGDGSDDDALSFPSYMQIIPGGSLNIPFSYENTPGGTAYLEMWIDWNGDGDFDDANEMVVDLDDTSPFPAYLPIAIPSDAITDQAIGVRARLSNTDNMTPYGAIGSGEVEDYLIEVSCKPNVCLPVYAQPNNED